MPFHAQIVCIGGNAIICLILLIAAGQGVSSGDFGMALFCFVLAAAAAYTIWVLMKFRHYLGQEATLEREVHMEHQGRTGGRTGQARGGEADLEILTRQRLCLM